VYDETTPLTPAPNRAARVALNRDILAGAANGVRAVVLCPALIYGLGQGLEPHSMQVPWLIALARKDGVAKHAGPGANIWSNVHIDDLTALYLLALEKAPAGMFYFAENGENSMREVCVAIGRMLGHDSGPEAMTMAEASAEWGEGPAHDTMGSNSRVRAVGARRELGWNPAAPSLIEEMTTLPVALRVSSMLSASAVRSIGNVWPTSGCSLPAAYHSLSRASVSLVRSGRLRR
jgi:nucleoside-diphosphate-sugar epimerase